MATENFTTYTEADPDSILTRTSSRVSVNGDLRYPTAMTGVHKDHGSAHFDGDFEHLLTMYADDASGNNPNPGAYWALTTIVDVRLDIRNAAGEYEVCVYLQKDGTGTATAVLIEEYTSTAIDSQSGFATDTVYYCEFERDVSVGTYGTIYLRLYSDAARTTQVGTTLSQALHADVDYRHTIAMQGFDESSSAGKTVVGYVENVDLQEAASGAIAVLRRRLESA